MCTVGVVILALTLRELPKKIRNSEVDQSEADKDRKKFCFILKGALSDIKSNKRIWMACIGNFCALITFYCSLLFGSVIYYEQKRSETYALITLVGQFSTIGLIILVGYALSKTTDTNSYDLKLLSGYLFAILVSNLSF
jgi:hypothetical protein